MKIGFIGLGIMGKPMAKNLLKAGYEVLVNTRNRAAVDEAVACGAAYAERKELAEKCDIVFTMLPDGPQVLEVMSGPDGVGAAMKPGSVYVDTSSVNPKVSRVLAAELAGYGVEMLDAPVSGGETKAIDGTLAFMVGGKQEVFDRIKPVLLAMGSSAIRCGETGAGNTTKLANQIIVAANIQAVSEALSFAKLSGVDPEVVTEAISGGLAGSEVLRSKAPKMMSGDDKPGFRIDLHIKDLKNVLNCADEIGAAVPMTAGVQEIFEWLRDAGCGSDDHSSVIKYYKMLDDIESLKD